MAAQEPRPQKRIRWSPLEEAHLRAHVATYGESNWAVILARHTEDFDPKRTNVDLKDKWRLLKRRC